MTQYHDAADEKPLQSRASVVLSQSPAALQMHAVSFQHGPSRFMPNLASSWEHQDLLGNGWEAA